MYLEKLSREKLEVQRHVASNAQSFFQYCEVPGLSFGTLRALTLHTLKVIDAYFDAYCVKESEVCFQLAKRKNFNERWLLRDIYLDLINEVYFSLNKSHGFKLPQTFDEIQCLVRSGYNLRMIDKVYHYQLSQRWLHDVLIGKLIRFMEDHVNLSSLIAIYCAIMF